MIYKSAMHPRNAVYILYMLIYHEEVLAYMNILLLAAVMYKVLLAARHPHQPYSPAPPSSAASVAEHIHSYAGSRLIGCARFVIRY